MKPGMQPDGTLLIGPAEIREAVAEYLFARGYQAPHPKPGGYGPADPIRVSLEVDSEGDVFAYAWVRS